MFDKVPQKRIWWRRKIKIPSIDWHGQCPCSPRLTWHKISNFKLCWWVYNSERDQRCVLLTRRRERAGDRDCQTERQCLTKEWKTDETQSVVQTENLPKHSSGHNWFLAFWRGGQHWWSVTVTFFWSKRRTEYSSLIDIEVKIAPLGRHDD